MKTRKEILSIVVNGIESSETAFKITDSLCDLIGIDEENPYSKTMKDYVVLSGSTYVNKQGEICSACFKLVGKRKVYYTKKENLLEI